MPSTSINNTVSLSDTVELWIILCAVALQKVVKSGLRCLPIRIGTVVLFGFLLAAVEDIGQRQLDCL